MGDVKDSAVVWATEPMTKLVSDSVSHETAQAPAAERDSAQASEQTMGENGPPTKTRRRKQPLSVIE